MSATSESKDPLDTLRPGAAEVGQRRRGPRGRTELAGAIVSTAAAALITVVALLWFPIDQEAIVRADDAG